MGNVFKNIREAKSIIKKGGYEFQYNDYFKGKACEVWRNSAGDKIIVLVNTHEYY